MSRNIRGRLDRLERRMPSPPAKTLWDWLSGHSALEDLPKDLQEKLRPALEADVHRDLIEERLQELEAQVKAREESVRLCAPREMPTNGMTKGHKQGQGE